jgi:hypothetical protein
MRCQMCRQGMDRLQLSAAGCFGAFFGFGTPQRPHRESGADGSKKRMDSGGNRETSRADGSAIVCASRDGDDDGRRGMACFGWDQMTLFIHEMHEAARTSKTLKGVTKG